MSLAESIDSHASEIGAQCQQREHSAVEEEPHEGAIRLKTSGLQLKASEEHVEGLRRGRCA